MRKNNSIGSSFDELLAEESQLEQATVVAQKRVLAWQLAKAMRERKITKADLARRMRTSRSALDRLLDPRNASARSRPWAALRLRSASGCRSD